MFTDGQYGGSEEFKSYVKRFNSIFAVPKNTDRFVVSGNHDIGFHYDIKPYLNERFVDAMSANNVQSISIRGNHFVLINSMALEKDGCFLCKPTEEAISNVSESLKCAKDVGHNCDKTNFIRRYSRPILLQHFPLYRESDEICNEIDEAPGHEKTDKFREKYDCLSKEASDQLMDALNPRLVVDGHTHHGCRKVHRQDIFEMTVPSFNFRYKDNPSFLMGVFTQNNYALSKCYLPVESKVIKIYMIVGICTIVYLVLQYRKKVHNSRYIV